MSQPRGADLPTPDSTFQSSGLPVSRFDKEDYRVELGEGLDEITRVRLAEADPIITRTAYQVALRGFHRWCSDHHQTPLPAHDSTLTRYVSHLITIGRAPATIGQHIGAIRTAHRRAGHKGRPVSDDAADLLRGYRRQLAETGVGQRQATPITPEALRAMVSTLDLGSVTGQRDQLVLVLGFFGMLRRSELVALWARDTTITGDGVTLVVRTSKTDKNSEGRYVPIPPQTFADVEPVTLTQRWLDRLGDEGPLLRRVTRDDQLTNLRWHPGGVSDLVKRCARKAQLPSPDSYSAHSLRAGGLTASLRNGTPLGVAARHGGWDPESPVPARYARVADQWRDNAMRGVL